MTSVNAAARPQLDVVASREDFPILRRRIHERPLVYLDNAATTYRVRGHIEKELRLTAHPRPS
jgi:cysteine desulfurase/selenocysteine lyase